MRLDTISEVLSEAGLDAWAAAVDSVRGTRRATVEGWVRERAGRLVGDRRQGWVRSRGGAERGCEGLEAWAAAVDLVRGTRRATVERWVSITEGR